MLNQNSGSYGQLQFLTQHPN